MLQDRLVELEHELKALKYQALVTQTTGSSSAQDQSAANQPTGSAQPAPACRSSSSSGSVAKSSLTQRVLLDAVQGQQFALSGLQALMSNYSVCPVPC